MGASLYVRLYSGAPKRRDPSGCAGSCGVTMHIRSGPEADPGTGPRHDQSATQSETSDAAVSARAEYALVIS